jgi:dihydrolipoamide dehydrogenase
LALWEEPASILDAYLSKLLIQPADVARSIQRAGRLGIDARLEGVDFPFIMNRMRSYISKKRKLLEEMVESSTDIILFKEAAEFTGDFTMKVGERTITAPRIVIGTGASPIVPPIPGLTEAGYLDNVSLLALEKLPNDLVIIGGGYVGCEYANFFSAMGSRVVLLGRSPEILDAEEPEISSIVRKALSGYMKIRTGQEVVSVNLMKDGRKIVSAKSRLDGAIRKFEAEDVLVAAGRKSNSDFLKPEATGIKTDAHGWILVNEYLETTKPGIWAIGDATGRNMFRHTANYEADLVGKKHL